MFEKSAIFAASLVFIIFSIASIKTLELTGLEAESPIAVFKEMFPPIDTTDS